MMIISFTENVTPSHNARYSRALVHPHGERNGLWRCFAPRPSQRGRPLEKRRRIVLASVARGFDARATHPLLKVARGMTQIRDSSWREGGIYKPRARALAAAAWAISPAGVRDGGEDDDARM